MIYANVPYDELLKPSWMRCGMKSGKLGKDRLAKMLLANFIFFYNGRDYFPFFNCRVRSYEV